MSLKSDFIDAATRYCLSPAHNTPSLSFTLTSFYPGELDENCKNILKRAVRLGFTTVAISPSFEFDLTHSKLIPGKTLFKGEVARCLDEALEMGINIVYQPHLESPNTTNTYSESGWRGWFKINPDALFENEVFGEFKTWVEKNIKKINNDELQIDIIPIAELETSTAIFTKGWINIVHSLREWTLHYTFKNHIRLGINPNWKPVIEPKDSSEFNYLLSLFDFVAPSFYGDWRDFDKGINQIEQHKSNVLNSISRKNSWFGTPLRFDNLSFAIGEFGVGPSISKTYKASKVNVPLTSAYILNRRQIFKNLIDWAKTQSSTYYLNLWTLGFFDPVGIRQWPDMIVDIEIQKFIYDYTLWRCGENQ